MTPTDDFNRAVSLAAERGYKYPELWGSTVTGKVLVVYTKDGVAVNYADEILAPRGLAEFDQRCPDWQEACRLLGMLPPARDEIEPTRDTLHPQGF